MSHSLTVQLPDDLYAAIERAARQAGLPPEILVVEGVKRAVAERDSHMPAPSDDAWARLQNHFGKIQGENPNGSDNDRIDADLASG